MPNSNEVIDVEEFHRDAKRKFDDNVKKKYQKLKIDMQSLEIKNNSLGHANDALRRSVFNKEQCSRRIARLLGFDDIESAEASITAEDPWIPGGQAALTDAHTRNLQLEQELAKHVTTNKEAHSAISEMLEQLFDIQSEAARLREGRDLARQEAERQAAEARTLRTELQKMQTMLPEMQFLIQELQIKSRVQAHPPHGSDKENISSREGEASSSPLRDVVNATSSIPIASAPPPPNDISDAQHYKQQFEVLQAQYNALLASKKRVSQNYRRDMADWKIFKEWAVKDETATTGRRMVKRKRVTKEVGLNTDPRELDVAEDSGKQDGPVEDPDMTLLNPTDTAHKPVDDAVNKPHNLPHPAMCSPPPSPFRLPSSPDPAPCEESLTQQSTVPPSSQHPLPMGFPVSSPSNSEDIRLSQESLTEASSPPPSTPVLKPVAARPKTTESTKARSDPEVIVIDSSPEIVKQESLEKRIVSNNRQGPSGQQATNPPIKSLRSRLVTDRRAETPKTRSELPPDRKRPRTTQPISEPPLAHKFKSSLSSNFKSDARAIRRTSTVLVKDTPPRASARAVFRHHSSPPDSPHASRRDPDSSPSAVRKGKRKAVEMQDEEDDGNESDPFIEGPSRAGGKPIIFQTREEKTTHLKALGKKPHKEYMAEYLPFKGRGRYSNANVTTDKTVNAEFEIDPAKNGGVNYRFDAVVRDKAERKQLEAGDCECCHDYYEAVGPLPPRLQPPLWRSPSSSQSQHRPCRNKNKAGPSHGDPPSTPPQAKAIEAHKHEISRHRHNWAPTNTPPDYWHIGFPSTQAVEDINRRANDMHEAKFRRVEKEANSKNGRYRKRT